MNQQPTVVSPHIGWLQKLHLKTPQSQQQTSVCILHLCERKCFSTPEDGSSLYALFIKGNWRSQDYIYYTNPIQSNAQVKIACIISVFLLFSSCILVLNSDLAHGKASQILYWLKGHHQGPISGNNIEHTTKTRPMDDNKNNNNPILTDHCLCVSMPYRLTPKVKVATTSLKHWI